MLMFALPALNGVVAELYLPVLIVTVPVGVGSPVPPLPAIATARVSDCDCAQVRVVEDGVTVKHGASTLTDEVPEEKLYTEELAASGT